MKAAQINSYGDSKIIEVNQDSPKPTPKPGQVLVEVISASINPVDWKFREGHLQKMAPVSLPVTLGGDFSGKIVEVNDDVTDLKIGDEVYGQAIVLNGGSGSMAEFVAANNANTALKPTSIDFEKASALPLVGVSALQALEDHIKLQSGQKILIHGGAGGIGSIAIQVAKSIGAYVATTVSAKDVDFVKELGVDEVIDYKAQKFEDLLHNFDGVFDTVGGETTDKSFQVLKKGGVIVSMLGQPSEELAKKYEVTVLGQGTQTDTAHLKHLAELVDSGKISVHVDKVFPLDQVQEAFVYQETNHPRGKVVIKIK